METTAYKSQQEAVTRKAAEKGTPLEDLGTSFDQKFDAIVHEHPGSLPAWRLGRAQDLVWEKLFREPFPGSMKPPAADTKPRGVQDTDSYRPVDTMAMTRDWVHDKYQAESPERRETGVENRNRKPDYYSGPAFPGQTNSYKPSVRSNNDQRDGRHSDRPFSRGAEAHDDGRYSVNKPTIPFSRGADEHDDGRFSAKQPTVYTTLHDYILKRAFAAGISPDSYHYAYYKYGKMAKEEKPLASAYWLLWRQECMIWNKFFPDEGFIGAEPKLQPTTWETAPTNFSLMSSEQLQRSFKCSPTYGRLSKEDDLRNSIPNGPSSLPKKPIMTTQNISQYPSHAHLIESKARARKLSTESLLAIYDEKQKLVKRHFPKQCQEWQRWFVEATVWGHLFKDAPFPGREPRSPNRSRYNKLVVTSTLDDNRASSYAPQEKVMEQMALKKGIRREFFQYLNTTRHDAIAVYPLCTCYARNFFADRLTWQKFFQEPFPVPGPHRDHSEHCKANEDPCSAQSQPPSGQSAIQRQPLIASQSSQKAQSQLQRKNISSTAVSSRLASSPSPIPTQAPGPYKSSQVQNNNVKYTSGHSYQHPPQALANAQSQVINPQCSLRALPASSFRETVENSPPPGILLALSEMRMARQIPEGAVVMQNMDATICNTEAVAQMLQCLHSEDPASFDSISNGLKCHFRYRGRLNGDLLLWIDPFTPGDSSAFAGGHLFLRGWVQRNLGFGIVPPSLYFNEIRNTTSFKQAAATPTVSDKRNGIFPALKIDDAKDTWSQNANGPVRDAVLVIHGDNVGNLSCSCAALKNLAFSFVIDSCKDKVEQRLRCTFSLTEPEGGSKYDGRRLELVVKPLWGNDKESLSIATRFAQAWASHAIQPTPCKASAFLESPEGLQILGRSFYSTPASNESGKRLGDPEKLRERKSPFNPSDLDRMLAEETAKAEGSSRLVFDEVTGQVISVQELLRQTFYRASAKMLESSAMAGAEVAEDDEDGCVEITGTDGQMKDMGGGKFVVVANSMDYELSDGANGQRMVGEDRIAGDRIEEAETAVETAKETEKRAPLGVGAEMAILADGPAATPLENGSEVVQSSEPTNGKRKAEDDEGEDRAEKKICF